MKPATTLTEIKPEPLGENVIERLEFLLEKAKAGEISSFACALVYRDGCSGQVWSEIPHLSIMVGALERMKFEMLRAFED